MCGGNAAFLSNYFDHCLLLLLPLVVLFASTMLIVCKIHSISHVITHEWTLSTCSGGGYGGTAGGG